MYFNSNTFLNKLHDLHEEDRKRYERKLRYFQRLPVLILNDWLMISIHDQVRESMILNFIDARYGTVIIIICPQVDPDDWCERFSGYTIGNAITSRLLANGCTIVIQSEQDLLKTEYPGSIFMKQPAQFSRVNDSDTPKYPGFIIDPFQAVKSALSDSVPVLIELDVGSYFLHLLDELEGLHVDDGVVRAL